VVQEGDTLAAIAQRFGTTVEAMQAANGIEDPNEIIIGQVLVIP
jgi:LysM repeat protein